MQSVVPLSTCESSSLFDYVLSAIGERAPLQRKRLRAFLRGQDQEYFIEARKILAVYDSYLRTEGASIDEAIDAYLALCREILTLQVRFAQTGVYPMENAATANQLVYANPQSMRPYVLGLALTLIFWPTHYTMYRRFQEWLRRHAPRTTRYLEIGPGHGAFLGAALELLPAESSLHAIDISPTSLSISRSIVNVMHPSQAVRVSFEERDVLTFDDSTTFDFVTMGEVLEHVDTPTMLLAKLRKLLLPQGAAFISTCTNAPTVDHVYHFKTIAEIQSMLRDCGLAILHEEILPVEDRPMVEIIEKRITVNYCALVQPRC